MVGGTIILLLLKKKHRPISFVLWYLVSNMARLLIRWYVLSIWIGHNLIYLRLQDCAYWKYLLEAITIDNYGLSAVTDNWHRSSLMDLTINTSSGEILWLMLIGTWKTSNMQDDSMMLIQANGYWSLSIKPILHTADSSISVRCVKISWLIQISLLCDQFPCIPTAVQNSVVSCGKEVYLHKKDASTDPDI